MRDKWELQAAADEEAAPDAAPDRKQWNKGMQFFLSCLSISIGLGNVWRFPTLAYQNGGGAFLIPYFIVLFLIGKPVYFMELAIGQFVGKSHVKIWKCVPGLKGIGVAQLFSTFYVTVSYNYIMALCLFYLFASFQSYLPWSRCDGDWSDATCVDSFSGSGNMSNITKASSAPEQYFQNYVLRDSGGFTLPSSLDWRMALCFLLAWICEALSTFKGIRSVGKLEIDAEEDSSSDDDDSHVYATKFAELFAEPLPVFKVHEYVRKVVHTYSEEQFRRNFRLPRRACYDLIRQFEKSDFFPFDRHHGGAPAKTPEEHILSFLWYAVNKASIREVALLFNMADSTQLTVIDRVLGFLFAIAPEVIYFASDKEALARDFKKLAGFPNVIGCIDGTYIPVRCPVNKVRSTYINRHDQVSITMQGICDSNRRFQDVFTGPPSKVHDARVLKLSPVQENLPMLCEINRYHILGDAAYPIREHLLTPYRNYGNMTADKTAYNDRHTSTRVVIENSFGLLKQRFRQLRYVELTTVDKITLFIVGCCVLHNICLSNGDTDVEDLLTDEERRKKA